MLLLSYWYYYFCTFSFFPVFVLCLQYCSTDKGSDKYLQYMTKEVTNIKATKFDWAANFLIVISHFFHTTNTLWNTVENCFKNSLDYGNYNYENEHLLCFSIHCFYIYVYCCYWKYTLLPQKQTSVEHQRTLYHCLTQIYKTMNIKLTQEAGRLGLASLPAPSTVGSCKLSHNSTICELVHCLRLGLLPDWAASYMQLNFDYKLLQPQNLLIDVFMSWDS